MKGFIRIVEIIIIILAVFVLIVQFFNYPQPNNDWARTKLNLLVNDIASGVGKIENTEYNGYRNWFDPEKVDKLIADAGIEGMEYSIEIINDIKEKIRVACLCNDEEFDYIVSILRYPIIINGRERSFEVHQFDPEADNPSFSTEFDVYVLEETYYDNHYIAESDSTKNKVERYLDFYGGIIAFTNSGFILNDFEWYGLQPLFGADAGNVFVFDPSVKTGLSTYNEIFLLSTRIPIIGTLSDPEYLGDIYEFVTPVSVRGYTPEIGHGILRDRNNNYVSTGNIFNGRGRIAWLSKFNEDNKEVQTLLKTLIVWASRHRYYVKKTNIPGNVVSTSRIYYIEENPNPMPQNIEVVFSAGYTF